MLKEFVERLRKDAILPYTKRDVTRSKMNNFTTGTLESITVTVYGETYYALPLLLKPDHAPLQAGKESV